MPVPGRRGALSLIGTRGDRLVLAHESDDWRETFLASEVRSWIW